MKNEAPTRSIGSPGLRRSGTEQDALDVGPGLEADQHAGPAVNDRFTTYHAGGCHMLLALMLGTRH